MQLSINCRNYIKNHQRTDDVGGTVHLIETVVAE